jgi:ATP-dependent DNA helicase DinG
MAETGNEQNVDSMVGASIGSTGMASPTLLCPDGWELRPTQRTALERIEAAFASGKKVVAVQGPTGSGKSLIGVAAALAFGESYYLVPLKALQDQVSSDFDGTVKVFKGKSNYRCNVYPSKEALLKNPGLSYTVDIAPCQERGMGQQRKTCREKKTCDYYNAFDAAIEGPHTLMNFSLYLAWMRIRELLPERAPFKQRPLHVIDEAHRIEDFIRDHLTVELSTKRIEKYLGWMAAIDYLDNDTILETLQEMQKRNNEELEKLRAIHGPDLEAVATEIGSDKLDFHLSLDAKFERYFKEPENYVMTLDERYSRGEMVKYIVVKPLTVGGFIKSHVCGEQTLLLSATLSLRAVTQMGFREDEIEYIDLPSTFPAENRLIKFRGIGRVNKDSQEKLTYKMACEVEKILQAHPDVKGIIHTNSYQLSKALVQTMDDTFRPRLLIQDQEGVTAKKMLEDHVSSPDPTVLVSPGMKEGIDLKGDLSRFQIICKCPYPNLGDPAVKALADKDYLWYVNKTITDFLQMYGRSIRSADDYAVTYCLDDNLRILLATYRAFVPSWVMDAVRWVDK